MKGEISMRQYDGTSITLQNFKIAFPELYSAIREEAQLEVPDVEVSERRTLRAAIADDIHNRLNYRSAGNVEPNLSIEERAKQSWNRDSNLREEFRENFASYLAFFKQSEAGNVRIFKKTG
jgi:hypothetical protein